MYHPDIQHFEVTKQYYGEIHGKLIVEKIVEHKKGSGNNRYWSCYCCKCGEFKEVLSQSLKNGIEMCYDCNPNCKGGNGKSNGSVQQQAEFNRNRYTKGGYEI